jgi:3-oxoadipate CoA-transferase beta subunit
MSLTRDQIAWRSAQDLRDGQYVNLGIGVPLLVAEHVPENLEIVFHSENGLLGFGRAPAEGEADPDMVNAAKQSVTLLPGGSFFDHTDSFMMIRGGHLDVALLGAFEVAENGDLANWTLSEPTQARGVGGAMDLAIGAKEVRVLVEHTTKDGRPRILNRCTLPLTGAKCVKRIYTNLAVIDVEAEGLVVREVVEGYAPEQLQSLTEPKLNFDPALKVIDIRGFAA